jgi:2-polyprenyl-6-methoxyphenol hydroxylase-like FAD-dependent oxidoreductase
VRDNGIDIHLVMHDTREPVDRAETTEVVVVGAGPTGLTAAIRLAELGAGDELVAAGRRIRRIVIVDRGQVLTRIDLSNVPSRYPFALGVPQSTTERVLLRRLAALDGSVRREHRVGSVQQDPNGYLVAGAAYGSEPFQVRAGYVIGADGARSAVRSAIGQDFPGQTHPSQFVLADVALASAPCADDEASINLSRDGVTVIGRLPSGNYRIIATVEPGIEVPEAPDKPYVDARVRFAWIILLAARLLRQQQPAART